MNDKDTSTALLVRYVSLKQQAMSCSGDFHTSTRSNLWNYTSNTKATSSSIRLEYTCCSSSSQDIGFICQSGPSNMHLLEGLLLQLFMALLQYDIDVFGNCSVVSIL